MPYLLQLEGRVAQDSFESAKTKKTLVVAKTACGTDAILAIAMAECAFGFVFANGKDTYASSLPG